MEKYKSAVQWLVLGAVFILILFVFGYLTSYGVIPFSYITGALVPAIFGAGGALFLVIGIIKAVVSGLKK